MTQKERDKIKKAYEEVRKKNPDIKDERQIELLTRKYVFDRKIKSVGVVFLIGFVLTVAFALMPEVMFGKEIDNLIKGLALGAGSVCALVACLRLAKLLHNPLTPKEAQELKEIEHQEKTGKPYVEDNNDY